MAKVHLIYFDLHTGYYPGFHHGIAYLIGGLKKENNEVFLSHLTTEDDFEKARSIQSQVKPDLVGLSFTTNQKKHVRNFLKKGDLSSGLIIAGGVHCTLVKEQIFEDFPQISGICIGEGDFPIKELCRRIDNGEDYFTTPSFYFKRKEVIFKNPINPLQAIDSLSLPDYSLFDYRKIIMEGGQSFQMMLSRGCPYNCNYCCNHAIRTVYPNKEKYVRFPTVSNAISIIKSNLLLYPDAEKIVFADDTFTLDKKWLSDFCKSYKESIGLPFWGNARIETIDDDTVRCLKNAGCVSLDFGVESGNEWLRSNILNRKHSNEKIKEAFRITQKYGIKRFSYSMIGLPFETKEMAMDTLDLNLEIKPNFGKCFYFYPYPGTKIYQLCLDYRLLLDDIEFMSGYLEAPSLKEVFMTHSQIKKYFDLLQVFFYTRLLFSKLKIPSLLEKILLKSLFLIRKPVLAFFAPASQHKLIARARNKVRRLAMKYLR